jgi:hypothetical protein
MMQRREHSRRLRRVLLSMASAGISFVIFSVGMMAQDQPNSPTQSGSQPGQSQPDSTSPPPSQSTPPPQDQSSPQTPPDAKPDQTHDQSQENQDKQNSDKDEKKDDSSNPAAAVVDKTKDVTEQAVDKTKEAAQQTFTKVRDWETEWVVGAYVGRNRKLVPLTAAGREDLYLQQTFLTPGAYLKRMFSAAIDQARGAPPQWDGGVKGYAERWASREGQFFAANSLAAAGNAALHYEPRYDQCRCQGFWPRTRHAILRNFMTYNETERELRPQWALYGGAFGGGVIADAWKPKPRSAWAEGGRGMLGQAAWGTLQNFFNEFAVDINRKLGGKQ